MTVTEPSSKSPKATAKTTGVKTTAAKKTAAKTTAAARQRKTNQSGAETKDKILDAALDVVRTDGMIGASARNIARRGDFNQALVFYHFGSVEELMVAALERAGCRRMERYQERLEAVTTLADLVAIASDLHAGPEDPDSPALAAIVAAWSQSSGLGPRILDLLQPWNDLIAAAIRRATAGSPLAAVVPADELAHGVAALFLGIEVFDRLDPSSDKTARLFTALGALAAIAEPTMQALQALQAERAEG